LLGATEKDSGSDGGCASTETRFGARQASTLPGS
jgi:hypothetical protein